MAICLSETLVTPAEATRHFPGRPHVSSIWRWMTRGCRGIQLENIVCAGRRFTSLEAIERFIHATNAVGHGEPPAAHTPRQRQAAIDRAERELAQGRKTQRVKGGG